MNPSPNVCQVSNELSVSWMASRIRLATTPSAARRVAQRKTRSAEPRVGRPASHGAEGRVVIDASCGMSVAGQGREMEARSAPTPSIGALRQEEGFVDQGQ